MNEGAFQFSTFPSITFSTANYNLIYLTDFSIIETTKANKSHHFIIKTITVLTQSHGQ